MEALSGNIITLIPLILIIFLTLSNKVNFKKKSTKYYLYALIITAIESAIEIYLMYSSCSGKCTPIFTLLLILSSCIMAPLVGYNLVAIALIDTPFDKYKKLFMLPIFFNILASGYRVFMSFETLLSDPRKYYHHSLFWVHFTIGIFYLIIFLVLDIGKSKRYYIDDKICFIVTYSMMIVCIFTQLFFCDLRLIWPSVSMSLIFYYIANLNHNLNHDVLTKLYNRNMYEKLLSKYNRKKQVTIINIDVNDFKDINDTSGHYVGDEALQQVALVLTKYFSSYGNVLRIGGDEFCVILTKPLQTTINSLFHLIETDLVNVKNDVGIPKLLSYGYATYTPSIDTDIFHAIKSADKYMYTFKQNYKSKISQ